MSNGSIVFFFRFRISLFLRNLFLFLFFFLLVVRTTDLSARMIVSGKSVRPLRLLWISSAKELLLCVLLLLFTFLFGGRVGGGGMESRRLIGRGFNASRISFRALARSPSSNCSLVVSVNSSISRATFSSLALGNNSFVISSTM